MVIFILSQIIIAISYFFYILSYHQSKKQNILKMLTIGNVLFLLSYLLLQEWTVLLVGCVMTIKTLALYFLEKKQKNSIAVLIIFNVLTTLCCVLTWKGWLSFLFIVAYLIYNYGTWQQKRTIYIICSILYSFLFIVYNIIIFSPTACVMEGIFLVYGIVYFFVLKHKNGKETPA